MFVFLSRLVEVEVPEPEPREGKHHGWAFAPELEDRRVHPVGFLPPGQAQYPSRDDEVHEADDVTEVEDDDLAPPPRLAQRPADEPPPELLWLHVRYVGPEDGGPQDLAADREGGHVLRDHGDLGQFGHLGPSQQFLDVAGYAVFVHAWHDLVSGLADLVGHPPDRDSAPGEA